MIFTKNLFYFLILSLFRYGIAAEMDSLPTAQFEIQTNHPGAAIDIYYPLALELKKYTTIVILQGGRIDKSNYSHFASLLGSQGFIVAIANTPWNFGPIDLGDFPDTAIVNQTFHAVLSEGANAQSPLFNKVDPDRMGLVGHSFGGVTALMALDLTCTTSLPFCREPYQRRPELQAAVVLNTKSSLGPFSVTFHSNGIPVAFIAGSQDGKSSLTDVTATYQLATPPKALMTIQGANHFCMTNLNGASGAIPDARSPLLSQENCNQKAAYWTALYLNAYLNANGLAYETLIKSQSNPPEGIQIELDLK